MLCAHGSGVVVKYMPVNPDSLLKGSLQYSREEVWANLGRPRNMLDAEEVYHPEMDGYCVSSIMQG